MSTQDQYDVVFGDAKSPVPEIPNPNESNFRVPGTEPTINQPYWSLQDCPLEFVAGMIAIGVPIVRDLNENYPYRSYYINSTANLSLFRLERNVFGENIKSRTLGRIQPGYYGVWIASNQRYHYDLYTFRTNEFLRGILTMVDHVGKDFRDYLQGDIIDSTGTPQVLNGFLMREIQFALIGDEDDERPLDFTPSDNDEGDYYTDPPIKEEFDDEENTNPYRRTMDVYPEQNAIEGV